MTSSPKPRPFSDLNAVQVSVQPAGLDDQIAKLCEIYGKPAVKDALARIKIKRGRKPENDIYNLFQEFRDSANEWLKSGIMKSEYSLAHDFSKRSPGHNIIATNERVYKKLLKEKNNLKTLVYILALESSYDQHPYSSYVKALTAIVEHDSNIKFFANALESAKQNIEEALRLDPHLDRGTTYERIQSQLKDSRLANQ